MNKLKLIVAASALFLGTSATWAQTVGDIITVGDAEYEVKGANIITNGSFDDGVTGWYAANWAEANVTNYTYATSGGFDDGAYITVAAGGVGSEKNIRGKWAVTIGKTYLFRVYTSGKAPDNNNLQYSFLAYYDESKNNYEGDKLYQLKWGAETEWTENNFVFTATGDMVCYRTSWTSAAKLDGFVLCEVERYFSPEGYNKAMEAAKAARDADDYANVTGKERTDLVAAISEYTNASSDKYEEAISVLEAATTAFTAAKDAYDALVAAKAAETPELAYAAAAKKTALNEAKNATATSAEDATTKTAAITTALRAYYESHAHAEGVDGAVNMTDRIANPDAENGNDGWTWTGNKNNPASNEPWTGADGNSTHKYFDGGNWKGSNWTTTMKQTITLPAGKFLLTAKGRAATNTTLTMAVGEISVELPHVGNSGNVFGRGWGDGSIEFETDGSDVEILVTATAEPTHEWFSISAFRLMRLELYTEMAKEADYTAMNTALDAAKTKTLGFAAGEYAPYNNTEAIKAIALAEAVNTEAENAKDDINAITESLGKWTANTEEVDAIFDGQFATTEANATSGDINLPGWTKVQGIRLLVKNEETDPGLAYTDGKAAVFSWGGTTLTYGEQTGYTLPLEKSSVYELTLKMSGWRDGDLPNSVSVELDGVTQWADPSSNVNRINNAEVNPFTTLKFYFKPTADNSILKIFANHHFTIADLSLMKAVAENITLNEDADYAPANTYANVTLKRTIKEGFNTVCLPFDLTTEQVESVFGTDAKVYEYSETADGTNSTIYFNSKEGNTIAANVPYLVNATAAATEKTIEGVVTSDAGVKNVTGTNFDFVGTFDATTDVAEGDYFVGNGAIYESTGATTIAAFRAYIKAKTDGATARLVINGEEATGIETVAAKTGKNEKVYNLNGQLVNGAQKGIFIKNGKKVVVK